MKLLKTKQQYFTWAARTFAAHNRALAQTNEPKEYPCYAYLHITAWSLKNHRTSGEPSYLTLKDVAHMLRQLLPAGNFRVHPPAVTVRTLAEVDQERLDQLLAQLKRPERQDKP